MLNPTISDLIGGIQAVTLSDDEARRRGTQKTVLERKAPPTFDVVIELLDYDRLAVHHNVQKTVDLVLRGVPPKPEIRVRTGAGQFDIVQKAEAVESEDPGFNQKYPALARQPGSESPPRKDFSEKADRSEKPIREDQKGMPKLVAVYPYGVPRTRLERAIREKRSPAYVVNDIAQADAIMAIRSTYQSRPKKLRDMAGRPVKTVVIKSNTFGQISEALDEILKSSGHARDLENAAMDEVLAAIDTVIQTGKPFELNPQPAPIRKMQHQVTEARRMASESVGEEPHRRIRVLPTRLG